MNSHTNKRLALWKGPEEEPNTIPEPEPEPEPEPQTTVVNVRDHPRDSYIYIGRYSTSIDQPESIFANPFEINQSRSRADVIKSYAKYFYDKLEKDPTFKQQLQSLRGQRLGCWCKPAPCHGDVIANHLNGGEEPSYATQTSIGVKILGT